MVNELNLPGANLNFFRDIDELFSANVSYLDCIIHWCAKNNIDIEYVTPLLVSNNISIARLRCDGEALHFLKREVRIPL